MTLKQRVHAYLKKRNEPVSQKQLLDVAVKAGFKRATVSKLLWELEEPGIACWYGYKTDVPREQVGKREKWYQYYPMTEKQIKQYHEDNKWFDSL